jgi:hypothetical protein
MPTVVTKQVYAAVVTRREQIRAEGRGIAEILALSRWPRTTIPAANTSRPAPWLSGIEIARRTDRAAFGDRTQQMPILTTEWLFVAAKPSLVHASGIRSKVGVTLGAGQAGQSSGLPEAAERPVRTRRSVDSQARVILFTAAGDLNVSLARHIAVSALIASEATRKREPADDAWYEQKQPRAHQVGVSKNEPCSFDATASIDHGELEQERTRKYRRFHCRLACCRHHRGDLVAVTSSN